MSAETCTRTVTITNRHGLHARPAVVIVKTVRKYDAQVTIQKGNQTVDAASILDLLSLGAAQGSKLLLTAKGRQAEKVTEALGRLFDAGIRGGLQGLTGEVFTDQAHVLRRGLQRQGAGAHHAIGAGADDLQHPVDAAIDPLRIVAGRPRQGRD